MKNISDNVVASYLGTKNNIDWTVWEKDYGRTLNESERMEIYCNSIEFMNLLIDEYENNPETRRYFKEKRNTDLKNKTTVLGQRLKKSLE